MNVKGGKEGLPDLREFLDKLPRKPCPSKLPPEYCKICRRLNRDVANYCETRKLPDRMPQKAEEEPEVPEPEEEIRPAGIERAVKAEDRPQTFQRKSPLLDRPDFQDGETSLEFVSSQRSREEAKKSLPKFIPVKKKPRAFIPLEEALPPPPEDFMAFELDDGKPSIFRSPDSLGISEDMFTLVSGDEALEVEPIIVEAEVMEATETVFQSEEGVVETVDISDGSGDVEFEPPIFEFMPEEEPVFAEAVEVVEEPALSPETDTLMDSIEEAEKGIQELVDEIAGTRESTAEDEFALDQAMFMPTAESFKREAALPKKKKKIKKVAGKRTLRKKKIKKVIRPKPAESYPEEPTPKVTTPEGPAEKEPMAAELPPREPLALEPPKKKKRKMMLKKVKKTVPAKVTPEEHIPEALPAESPTEEILEEEPVNEEFPYGEPLAEESIPDDFLSEEASSEGPAYEESVSEEPTYVEPAVEETPSEETELSVEDLESMIMAEEPQDMEAEEPVAEEEQPDKIESETQVPEEDEITGLPSEDEHAGEHPEEEGIDMESFEPPTETGFFFTPDGDAKDTNVGQLGLDEEEDTDFASKMKSLERHAPGFEITAPSESTDETPGEEPSEESEPDGPKTKKTAKKLKLIKKKKMKMKKLRMKPRKNSEDEDASEGGEDSG